MPAGEAVWRDAAGQCPYHSESETQTQLDFPIEKCRRKSKGLSRADIRCSVHVKGRSKRRADNIIHAGVVCVVGDVECFGGEQQVHPFPEFKGPTEAQVEVRITGADSRVAADARRAVVGEVAVSVDIRASEKIEGMAAIVREDRGKLEAAEDFGIFPGTFENAGEHDLVALIEVGKGVVATEASGVKGRIVAVEVCGVVVGAAVSVIREDRKVVGESLLDFE